MTLIEELLWLSRNLGDPRHSLAILAEGNASASSEGAFWVKASGHQLSDLHEKGLAKVDLLGALSCLEGGDLSDSATRETLSELSGGGPLPSVETFMHAYLLSLPGVKFVGHTHPTSLLSILCLNGASEFAKQRLFPDEIVCCGPESAYVPYVDPGLPLARAIRSSVREYSARRGEVPKTLWLQNHGLIALGATSKEVFGAHLMSEKAAQVRINALSTGQPMVALLAEDIERIHTRPDEHHRQQLLRQLISK